jgi:hypothetical protein
MQATLCQMSVLHATSYRYVTDHADGADGEQIFSEDFDLPVFT